MSIRPIDMQVMLPKTAEIGKIQHSELLKPEMDQQQFAQQLNKQTIQNQQHVMETDKSEKTLIKDDASKKRKNKNSKKDKKEDTDENTDKKKNKNTISTSIFDVKI